MLAGSLSSSSASSSLATGTRTDPILPHFYPVWNDKRLACHHRIYHWECPAQLSSLFDPIIEEPTLDWSPSLKTSNQICVLNSNEMDENGDCRLLGGILTEKRETSEKFQLIRREIYSLWGRLMIKGEWCRRCITREILIIRNSLRIFHAISWEFLK